MLALASLNDTRIKELGNHAEEMLPWRIHDIRRTVATGMANIGVQPHIIEAVLNHISGHKAGVAGIYNRAVYASEKRAALKRWAKELRTLKGQSTLFPLLFAIALAPDRRTALSAGSAVKLWDIAAGKEFAL